MDRNDPFEISNAFVANVLEDNQRLRAENVDLRDRLIDSTRRNDELRRDHRRELFRMVQAAGGRLRVKPHDGFYTEPQRLLIDVVYGSYGNGAEYRLIPEAEVPVVGEVVDFAGERAA